MKTNKLNMKDGELEMIVTRIRPMYVPLLGYITKTRTIFSDRREEERKKLGIIL